ncbi:hypothetical protein [Pseudomonas viridiflava]|uniref:hypothetical protein n=1 Tax=Pseudomonas viridiflava TaxID=33069 RepID=UPI0013CEF030|nr:hypothetical protein [Pseudomonas viridiflava]MBI6574243.1 hypothetical protein [Pseudomonas viridiflava]MBI6609473.1 hypothetical protein [Pseudomonas viridiflava]MBI6636765.1 hypothetical protein [Pseudomonas viridiflava]MBI6870391.1 hypothetical protein [Pseudomonas viridiflava]
MVVIDATPCAFIVMAGGKSKNDSAVESKTDWQHSSGSLNGSNTKCNPLLRIPCADYIQQALMLDPSKV